jgi:SMI1 / KNR4 family (SUKH-1)
MNIEEIVAELRGLPGCKCHDPLPNNSLLALEAKLGFRFPKEYRTFLRLCNGCESQHGHYRIFGFDTNRSIDVVRWNESDYWKCAWEGRADGYWCFGETAFGDQYAMAHAHLQCKDTVPVYQLHHASMASDAPWNESFSDFMEKEFLRNAKTPYSRRERHAIEVAGALDLANHVVMLPSFLLLPLDDDGSSIELQIMPARAAMICNGDICVQWDAGCDQGRSVERVEPFLDDQRRMRLKIVWSNQQGVEKGRSPIIERDEWGE